MVRWSNRVPLLILVACCAACSPRQAPPESGISNLDLAISLAALPDDLVVAVNQGSSFELRPEDETVGGIIWFGAGPEVEGVNLVVAVQEHQARIEGLPSGDYKGAQELQGPLGTAFYSRGRYLEGDTETEETILVTIHPAGNRMLTITYRYPAGNDSAARVEQLIETLALIE